MLFILSTVFSLVIFTALIQSTQTYDIFVKSVKIAHSRPATKQVS
jgi:hypothetical protein